MPVFQVRDLYRVIESVAYYRYLGADISSLERNSREGMEYRYGEEECCCCGQPRFSCLIICEDCNEIWEKASWKNGAAHDAMSKRIGKWLEQSQEYSFQRFLSVCSAEIDQIFPERKNKIIDRLIHCLREIQKKKVIDYDFREIDDLIYSVSERWNRSTL